MEKISCNIIRDVIPFYLDDAVSNDTKEMVEEHLKICEACRNEAALLNRETVLPENKSARLAEAEVLKGLKSRIYKRKIVAAAVSAVLTAAVIISLIFAFAVSRSCIPYSSSQFEILELDGNIYACYYGNIFGGSVVYEPVQAKIDGKQKNAVVFYSYKTLPDSIKSYFNNNDGSRQLIYLGNANEIDAVYYGEFDPRDPENEISTVIQNSELIWSE